MALMLLLWLGLLACSWKTFEILGQVKCVYGRILGFFGKVWKEFLEFNWVGEEMILVGLGWGGLGFLFRI